MANISGLLTTSNAQNTDLVGEWQQGVLVRNARGVGSGATLFGLMSILANETADNTTFNWWERDPVRVNYYSNASFNSSVATLTWDDGAGGAVYQLLSTNSILANNTTGEYVRVTADPTTASVAVERGALGTTAASITDNDLWTLVTSAADEGASPRRAAYEQPTSYSNYIQTFNETVTISNAYEGNRLRTNINGPLEEATRQALERISNRIEFAYFDGIKYSQSGSTGQLYFTGGIKNALTAASLTDNVLNGQSGTGVTLSTFKAWLRSFMVYGSNMKVAFCGPTAFTAVSDYANTAAGGFRIMNQSNVFGMEITTIVTPNGSLDLVSHPLFQTSIAHQGSMYVVDLQNIVQKVMHKLFYMNVNTNGVLNLTNQFVAMLGLKLKFPNAFGYAYNLQKITPDA